VDSAATALPLVSIVVPAYNHAPHLAEAIESLLAQSYTKLEVIVIDDGSTDGTPAVLARYSDRIACVTQPNMGQAATLNKGWHMARGEILGYLSADDRLEPEAVREAVRMLSARPDAVLCYCDFALIDARSRIIRPVAAGTIDYRDMLLKVRCPIGPGAFFRRHVLEHAGGWNESYRQMPDYDFWLRAGLLGEFAHIPAVLAHFRVHEGSQTFSRTTRERAMEPRAIVRSFFETPGLPAHIRALERQALSSADLVSAQLHVRAGRYGDASRCLRDAFRSSPRNLLSGNALRTLMNGFFNRVAHTLVCKLRDVFSSRA
jgi:glycosyltransferase involved in cell wall biosynthesis